MHNVFTYGSLMFTSVWQAVVKGHYTQLPASLKGFKRTRIITDTYPVVLPNLTTTILPGVLYKNVSHSDLRRLDKFEGRFYYRKSVRVKICAPENCEEFVTADIYVLRARFAYLASGLDWNPNQFANRGLKIFRRCYFGHQSTKP
jgi:gamma-glutamylcyclotransferase (GGCT)/AIG2-like uncharacterized protein YtfP